MSNNNFNGNNLPQITNGNNPFEIFNYKNLGSVRTSITENGEILFCLADVCQILEIKNPSQVSNRLFEKGVYNIYTPTKGGIQELLFIDRGNLNMAIGNSRKPEAKKFLYWVNYEVLPSIANKGYYALPNVTPAMAIVEIGKLLCDHEQRITNFESDITNTNQLVNDNTVRITEVERIQRQLIETGYISVKSFIVYHSLDTSSFDPAYLGRTASHICNAQGIPMGTEPSDNWNFVNTYPYQVLFEAYQKIMFNKMHN